MIDFIYEMFAKIGYPKPLHLSMTHIAEGLVASILILVRISEGKGEKRAGKVQKKIGQVEKFLGK